MKILLILAAVMVVFVGLGIAGAIYAGYRIKQKVERVSKDYGFDMSKPAGPAARRVDPCSLLSKEEASRILGAPVERVEREESGGSSTCHYHGTPVSVEESRQRVAEAVHALEKKETDTPENVAKAFIGGATGGASYFAVTVYWENGRANLMAMKLLQAAEPDMLRSVQGLGDDAAFGPLNSLLVFVKGSTGVQLDLRMVPDGRQKGIDAGKLIAARL